MKTSYVLSLLATIFAAVASAAGLFIPDLYHDNDFVRTVWQGNDAVTLVLVIPAMGLTLWRAGKGSLRARLIWMGLLLYLLYNYAFYLFGALFNAAFLLYAAVFSLSIFGLIYGLSTLPDFEIQLKSKAVRWVAGYLLLIAIILLMVEFIPAVRYIFTRETPEIILSTEHPTSVVYGLDLPIVVPLSVLAAVWFWRQRKWGYVLAVMMLVKGATYGAVLVVNTLWLRINQTGDDPLLPFYLFIALGGLIGLGHVLRAATIKTTI